MDEEMLVGGRWRDRARLLPAVAFGISGLIHLARPATFTPIVPRQLPAKTTLVYLSGAAELCCSAGLLRRRPWSGGAAALLLLAIWPANLQMAYAARHRGGLVPTLLWLRLPLQLPLIWCALQGSPTQQRRESCSR